MGLTILSMRRPHPSGECQHLLSALCTSVMPSGPSTCVRVTRGQGRWLTRAHGHSTISAKPAGCVRFSIPSTDLSDSSTCRGHLIGFRVALTGTSDYNGRQTGG